MSKPRLFVFRIDYDENYDFIKREAYQGRLRQGWGPHSLEGPGEVPDLEAYARAYQRKWPDDPLGAAQKRFWALSPMLDMKEGDLLVVPKFPERWGDAKFLVAQVSGRYYFDLASTDQNDDFGHVIPIDPSRMLEVGYRDNMEARTVSAKFRAYQNAVNNVWHEPFIEAVLALWSAESSKPATGDDWRGDLQRKLLQAARDRLRHLGAVDIESLVEIAFTHAGYDLQYRHRYDRAGGDADLVFSYTLPLLSEVGGEGLKVFVQVKHKNAKDLDDRVGVEQLDRITNGEPYALKVLFSTADEFTEDTIALAAEKEVILISGDQAIAFLSRGLATGIAPKAGLAPANT